VKAVSLKEIDGICVSAETRAVAPARTATMVARSVHNDKTLTMRRRHRPSAAGRRRRRSPPFPYPPRRLPRSNASWPRRFRDPPRANRHVRRALGRSRRRSTAPLASSRCASSDSFFLFFEKLREASSTSTARASARVLVSPRRARHSARRGASYERPGVRDVPRDDRRHLSRRARSPPASLQRLGGSACVRVGSCGGKRAS